MVSSAAGAGGHVDWRGIGSTSASKRLSSSASSNGKSAFLVAKPRKVDLVLVLPEVRHRFRNLPNLGGREGPGYIATAGIEETWAMRARSVRSRIPNAGNTVRTCGPRAEPRQDEQGGSQPPHTLSRPMHQDRGAVEGSNLRGPSRGSHGVPTLAIDGAAGLAARISGGSSALSATHQLAHIASGIPSTRRADCPPGSIVDRDAASSIGDKPRGSARGSGGSPRLRQREPSRPRGAGHRPLHQRLQRTDRRPRSRPRARSHRV